VTASVLGVDGCRSGWIVAALDPPSRLLTFAHFDSFRKIPTSGLVCAVDMPVELSADFAPRPCDLEARRRLGRQASSIFLAPPQALLRFTSHAEANAESRRVCGRGISIQAFHLFAKIRELQGAGSLIEAHPELAFAARAGGRALPRKSTAEGYAARAELLSRWRGLPSRQDAQAMFGGAKADDILDAAVLAEVAWRYSQQQAQSVGPATAARIWF
jgi:predicted RNase H-like nuclease